MAVIGGAGEMGRLFTSYFFSKEFSIIISDIVPVKTGKNVFWTNSNIEAVKKSKIVLITVPPEKVVSIFEEIAPYLKSDSIIVEVTSIKRHIVTRLRSYTGQDKIFLSIHPLFGPNEDDYKKWNTALIPVKNEKTELKKAQELFSETKFITFDVDEHDKAMAVVLSLAHVCAKNVNIKNIKDKNFALQLKTSEDILKYDPKLKMSLKQGISYLPAFFRLVSPNFFKFVRRAFDGLFLIFKEKQSSF